MSRTKKHPCGNCIAFGDEICMQNYLDCDYAELEEEKNVKTNKKEFHSSHYESDSIEPIEFMMSNKMDFCRASIVKYAFRAGKKEGQETLDIKKIIDYAILLAMQEGINFTKEDAQSIIDYRFNWKEERK